MERSLQQQLQQQQDDIEQLEDEKHQLAQDRNHYQEKAEHAGDGGGAHGNAAVLVTENKDLKAELEEQQQVCSLPAGTDSH